MPARADHVHPLPAITTNPSIIDKDITLASGHNGNSVGPIAIKKGTTVKIEKGAYWLIAGTSNTGTADTATSADHCLSGIRPADDLASH
jgi:hypothetical protein